jgi:hypothetical protein
MTLGLGTPGRKDDLSNLKADLSYQSLADFDQLIRLGTSSLALQ